MEEHPWYKEWFNSPFYHRLYFERDEAEAKAFIGQLIRHLNPAPGGRVLDVACGRGRHSKTMAAMGFDVIGIDISPDSIAWAKQFENEHLQFFVHDMRLPFYSNYFDCAVNLFTSFGYFRTRREHYDAVRTIATSLKKGGHFVLDYLNVNYAVDHLVPKEDKVIGSTIYHITRWHDHEHFYKKLVIEDPSLKENEVHVEKVAKFGLNDFKCMLEEQHMSILEVFGNYELGEYDERNTPRLIIVSGKK